MFDGDLFGNEAIASITVSPVNDVPVPQDRTLTTAVNTPVGVVLGGHDDDGDSLTFGIVTQPSHGVLSGTAPNLTYTPHLNYAGIDLFTFRAFDGTAFSAPATITIEVGLTGLVCGTLTSGTIAAAGEIDQHSFAGQAGQIISLAWPAPAGSRRVQAAV